MMMEDIDQEKYDRAKKQVEDEKGWYTHLLVYIVVNTFLQLFYFGVFEDFGITGDMPWVAHVLGPFFWGIGLLGHWMKAFKKVRSIKFYKNWEDRKIKEYMDEEEDGFTHTIKNRSLRK